ncbi:efflux RND transporter periplasmic adaptor subunit [bacterium]|nr:efflux RND transporter periplasmic adaptor subunit [bacterium]
MNFLGSFKKESTRKEIVVHPKNVTIKIADPKSVSTKISAYGKTISTQPITLFSEVTGIIEAGNIPFLPAQSFKKGQLLFKVDDRQIRLDLNSLKSDFLNALASVLPEIKLDFPDDYQRFQNYFNSCNFEDKLPPLPATKNQKIKLFLTRYNVYKLYYSIQRQEIMLEKHYFYAPFSGSVLSADLRIGSTVRPGSKIGQIINLDKLEVDAPIALNDIQWIRKNSPVTLYSAELNSKWEGKISRIGSTIDERTQTVHLYIAIKSTKTKKLYNGIFLNVQIPGEKIDNAETLPRKAIYDDRNIYLIKNGKLKYTAVNVVRKESHRVFINSGIQKGDTLVTEILQGVADGMPAAVRALTREADRNE